VGARADPWLVPGSVSAPAWPSAPQQALLLSPLRKTNQSTASLLSFLFPLKIQSPSKALGNGTKVTRSKSLASCPLANLFQGFFPTPSPGTNPGHDPLPLGGLGAPVATHPSRLPRWKSRLPPPTLPCLVSCGTPSGGRRQQGLTRTEAPAPCQALGRHFKHIFSCCSP